VKSLFQLKILEIAREIEQFGDPQYTSIILNVMVDHFEIDYEAAAKSGEIAHINRSKPHSEEGENAGQRYCTSSVRHGPVSA
jgi:hypothetical protein